MEKLKDDSLKRPWDMERVAELWKWYYAADRGEGMNRGTS